MTAMPQSIKNLWNIWTIRGVVLLSLFFQTVLILLSPNRKRFSQKIFAFIIWVAYLLADITADYGVGLISNNQCSDLSEDDRDLLVLWSAFLIVHLGGPDTITALALEDNELWLRHLLMLIFQAGATLYVFLQSLPNNKLMIPMILMFISGCIKYLERTWSLYFAHGDGFPSAGLNYHSLLDTDFESVYGSLSGKFDDLELLKAAYRLFRFYRGQFFDLIYSIKDLGNGAYLFDNITATTALRLIEMELNFMYDILFTKAVVVHSFMGFFFRFFSFCCLIASLAIFRFHITKHGVFNEINVAVTYVLFLGAVALEIIAFLMAILSDWTLLAIIDSRESEETLHQYWWRRIISKFVKPIFGKIWSFWTPPWYQVQGAQPEDEELRTCLLFRRWSGCLSRHNLIRHCLIDRVGLHVLLDKMTPLTREPLRKNLWNLIFEDLQKKSRFVYLEPNLRKVDERRTAYQFVSAKGDWVFQDKSDLDEDLRNNLKRYIGDLDEDLRNRLKRDIDAPFDESLLLWHVATELLYNKNPPNDVSKNNAEMSKILSDYMIYLLIMQPNLMAAVGAIGKKRFQDTCFAAKWFFVQEKLGPSQQVEACGRILVADKNEFEYLKELLQKKEYLREHDDILRAYGYDLDHRGVGDKSVLREARSLAKKLLKLGDKKWEIIIQVWVQLLCHAAAHGGGKAHAQQLSKGGELITFVWLLMSHFGLGKD